ncbi:MAG: TetR/AcrR family transcriptional regulator [Actinomycetota bacterium]
MAQERSDRPAAVPLRRGSATGARHQVGRAHYGAPIAAVTDPAEAAEATADPAPPTVQGRALRARGRRTMQRLLDAGTAVFTERGYHAARVDDVVKAARTSHGTFYLYFASKEDLFRALATEVASEMAALAREFPEITRGPEARMAIRAWLERFSDLYERCAAVIRTWTEAEMSDTEFGRIGGDLVGEFATSLAARIRAAAPDLDAQYAALAVVAMIERTHYFRATGTMRADRAATLDALADALQAGVCGAPRP